MEVQLLWVHFIFIQWAFAALSAGASMDANGGPLWVLTLSACGTRAIAGFFCSVLLLLWASDFLKLMHLDKREMRENNSRHVAQQHLNAALRAPVPCQYTMDSGTTLLVFSYPLGSHFFEPTCPRGCQREDDLTTWSSCTLDTGPILRYNL